jgi:hypothetical protein
MFFLLLPRLSSHVMPTLGIEGAAHGEVELSHDFSVIFVKKTPQIRNHAKRGTLFLPEG